MHIVEHLSHSFIPTLISSGGVALDCGANRGAFARWLSENTGAVVHSFEPDPRHYANLPKLARVTYHPIAIAEDNGTMRLRLGENRCSSLHYSENEAQTHLEVQTIRLKDFCKHHDIPFVEFIKMDIEGAEIPVLLGASDSFLRNVKQLTVEFHDFLDNRDIPRIKEVIARMKSLGFACVKFSHFTWGDVLFINGALVPVSTVNHFRIRVFGKYIPGLRRILKRKIG